MTTNANQKTFEPVLRSIGCEWTRNTISSYRPFFFCQPVNRPCHRPFLRLLGLTTSIVCTSVHVIVNTCSCLRVTRKKLLDLIDFGLPAGYFDLSEGLCWEHETSGLHRRLDVFSSSLALNSMLCLFSALALFHNYKVQLIAAWAYLCSGTTLPCTLNRIWF